MKQVKIKNSIQLFCRTRFKKFLLTLVYGFLGFLSFAQVDNHFLYDPALTNFADSNKLGFAIFNNNYMRNTEYYNKIEVGRTLLGYQLMPSLYYQANSHIRLQGGLFVRKDFGGNEPFTRVTPTFTLKIQNNKWLINFGTLEGTLNHRMLESMVDIASWIENPIENGFQLKHESKSLFFDTWIHWEKFIERGANEKEVLTAGLNYQPTLIASESGFSFTPITQGMISHRGGQIDTDTLKSFYVIANYAAGFRLMKQNPNAYIKEWRLEPYLLFYHQNDGTLYPFKGGSSVYLNAAAKTKNIGLMLSYWNGNQYIAPRGTPIYSSVSLDVPGYTEPDRQLLFIRIFYEKSLFEKLNLSLRTEPFYDINHSTFDYSFSVYLTYGGSWNFGKK
ncbi:MAG: hypothetical protein Q8M15_09710 [Bacteroidota bacterium]|nr:hypothetical protein [Bacteroidota bacterium]